jgi:hypothetical protein
MSRGKGVSWKAEWRARGTCTHSPSSPTQHHQSQLPHHVPRRHQVRARLLYLSFAFGDAGVGSEHASAHDPPRHGRSRRFAHRRRAGARAREKVVRRSRRSRRPGSRRQSRSSSRLRSGRARGGGEGSAAPAVRVSAPLITRPWLTATAGPRRNASTDWRAFIRLHAPALGLRSLHRVRPTRIPDNVRAGPQG